MSVASDSIQFNLHFSNLDGEQIDLGLQTGEVVFLLGANGTGKSSLIYHFARNNIGRMRKISAHRQTWMRTDTLDMTSANKQQTEAQVQSSDRKHQSRYRDDYAADRASLTIYDLIDAENVLARKIKAHVERKEMNLAAEACRNNAPIATINKLLMGSNIPIQIAIRENDRLVAVNSNGIEYGAAELSDGERNALLIAGSVLTAPPNTLLAIDEPERHLHRSIISPLLKQLFSLRPDCGFVVSTHDHDLPLQIPEARIILLRSCQFSGQKATSWEADELSDSNLIDESLKRDLIGARRNILFVEGTESSLDKSLYSIVFPMVSVIPKGSCGEVERAVDGANAAESYHWLQVFGIVDGDGYSTEQIEKKRERGIYALPVYSVEAIYFHPEILRRVAESMEKILGDDALSRFNQVPEAWVNEIKGHTERLSENAVKKIVRKSIMEQIPNDDDLLKCESVTLMNDANSILTQRKRELDLAVDSRDWEAILMKCPVRESNALHTIAKTLGFQNKFDYEKAVRELLIRDNKSLDFVKGLFSDLFSQLNA